MAHEGFQEARRDLRSLTAIAEKRALLWLAARLPAWVGPDHLTVLGLGALLLGGVAYAASRTSPLALHLVSLCLVLNWFGDSLDGTLARYRNRLRPRYGFYVDHVADAFGALFLLTGLACSGRVAPLLALALLVAYFLLAIDTYLATYTRGTFRLAHGGVGGTELRLLLVLVNLAAAIWPELHAFGWRLRLLDVVVALATLGVTGALVASVAGNTRALYHEERLAE